MQNKDGIGELLPLFYRSTKIDFEPGENLEAHYTLINLRAQAISSSK